MKSLSDKAGIIIVGRFIRAFIKLSIALVIIRILSKLNYGSYRQVFLTYELLSAIFLLGIPTSIFYFLPSSSSESERRSITLQSGLFLLGIGLFLTLLIYTSAPLVSEYFNNPGLSHLLRTFSLLPALDLPISILPPVLITLDKHKHAALANIIFSLTFGLPILIPLILGYSITYAFTALTIIAALQLIIVFIYVNQLFKKNGAVLKMSLFVKQLKYSVPAGFSGTVTMLSQHVDKIIISFFMLPAAFAIYSVGARELPFISIIPYAVSSVIFPRLVVLNKEKNYVEFIKIWHGAIRKTALVLIPSAILFYILASVIIRLLYTENYIESTSIFRIYLLLIPLRITAFNSALLAIGKPKIVLKITFLALLVNIIMSIILINYLGIKGPAIATVASIYLSSIIFLITISKNLHSNLFSIFPWKLLSKIILISGISGLVIFPITFIQANEYLTSVCVVITFLSICFALLYWFKIINESDIKQMKYWLSLKAFV